jgi:hypothetical protein
VYLVQTKSNLWRTNTFTCIQMCDHAVCISLHYTASFHSLLLFLILPHSALREATMLCSKCAMKYDKVCTPAPTMQVLLNRFYNLLPVAVWVKKIILSVSSLKDGFLVKKPFLCQLLLPIFVSPVTRAYTHFRRCSLAFKMTATF